MFNNECEYIPLPKLSSDSQVNPDYNYKILNYPELCSVMFTKLVISYNENYI